MLFKIDEREITLGLQFFQYFLITLLSQYDCYGHSDVMAGIFAFSLTTTLPIQWKTMLKAVMVQNRFEPALVKEVCECIKNQFISIYDHDPNAEFYRTIFNN